MIGKLSREDLAELVFSRTGAADESVLMGPKFGEDAAAIDVGGKTLVASSDPISLAAERVGTLGVYVASNDVASSGADPRWLTNVLFLPDDSPETLDEITAQMDEAARKLGVAIVGGHSEYAPELSRPKLSMTCFGVTDEFVPTGGAKPGDDVLLTKGAAIEGTAILATDFRHELTGTVPEDVIDRASEFFDEVSIAPEARVITGRANSMHDPTEGGVVEGLLEVAIASEARISVERDAVPVRGETQQICEAMGVDPLRIFGSGALVATVPDGVGADVVAELAEHDVRASVVGTVEAADEPALALDGETIREPIRDELYPLWE